MTETEILKNAITLSENITIDIAIARKQYNDLLDAHTALQVEFEQYKKESIKWSIEDIIYDSCGDEDENGNPIRLLTDEQGQEILENMIRHHDATLGINWDTIDVYRDMFLADLVEETPEKQWLTGKTLL